MKKLLLFAFMLSCLSHLNAQAQNRRRVYLFEKYTNGMVLLKNKVRIPTSLNYDTANGNIMYIDNGKEMILEEAQGIDTVYIGTAKFIPSGQHGFLEMVPCKNGIVFIKWDLSKQLRGKKGAYGQIIQGSVDVMDVNAIKQQGGAIERNQYIDVYVQQNNNEYWLLRNGKFVKCRNEKSLIKLFPDKMELIKSYIKKHKPEFSKPQQVLDLLDYCMGLQ